MNPSPEQISARRSPGNRKGFSLIECAMAVGIVATGLLVIVATIPVGLRQMADSKQTTAEGRILSAVLGDYQLKPWDVVVSQESSQGSSSSAGSTYHFDLSGSQVSASDTEKHWTALVQIVPAPTLPGETVTSPHSRLLEVKLTQVPNPDSSVWSDPQFHAVNRVPIANTDK